MVNFFVLTLFLIFVVVKDLPKRAGQNMSFMESATEKEKKKKKRNQNFTSNGEYLSNCTSFMVCSFVFHLITFFFLT